MAADESKSFVLLNQAQIVCTGRVLAVTAVGLHPGSLATLHYTLHFAIGELLRGTSPPQEFHFFHSVAQGEVPRFPTDVTWLVAAIQLEAVWGVQPWVVNYLVPADDALVDRARQAVALPPGWITTGGQVVSPWAATGAHTGRLRAPAIRRPARLAGTDIALTLESVPRWGARAGPGRGWDLQLTVTNRGAAPAEIPALLTDGSTILWEESVVILATSQAFWLPGQERTPVVLPRAGRAVAARPVHLPPGESVSTVIEQAVLQTLLGLTPETAPVYLQCCVGEQSASTILYVAPSDTEQRDIPSDADAFVRLNLAPLVFTGRLQRPASGRRTILASLSDPPVYHLPLRFDEVQVLRGTGDPTGRRFTYHLRTRRAPLLPEVERWVIGATDAGTIVYLAPADATQLELATQAVALLPGWTLDRGRPVSPWAACGPQAWPTNPLGSSPARCAVSGRPAWCAGEQIAVVSEQVPPQERQEYKNPYGGGKFTVTVINQGKTPAEIPALRTDDTTICWAESLLVISESLFFWLPGGGTMVFLLPGAGRAVPAAAVRLQPGERVSTVVDVLPLTDFQMRPGGTRFYYQFCLGEHSTENFFYYLNDFHTPMREAARPQWQEEDTG